MDLIKLWETFPPGHKEGEHIPHIKYFAPKKMPTGSAIITFAGGGYRMRALYECESYCNMLAEYGISMFDVEYRVKPTRFPYPLLDARRAIRYVRAHAKKYGIDPSKIAVMGSSAGGHLAALVSTYTAPIEGESSDEIDTVDFLPNAQILCYPVMDAISHNSSYLNLLGDDCTEDDKLRATPTNLVSSMTPPAFIWHTSSDPSVDVNGSLRYAQKLHDFKVPVEMHIYPLGGHGLGIANYPELKINVPYVQKWTNNLIDWLNLIKFI